MDKKRRLSLSRNKPLREVNASRFASPTKPDEFERAAEGVAPNTKGKIRSRPLVPFFLGWKSAINEYQTK